MMPNDAPQPATIITVFARSPDQGNGLARDMAVRWALEEIDRPYAVRTVALGKLKNPDHLARQPFGQIPAYEDDDIALFESGAIVWYLAQREEKLLPTDLSARARAMAWMFAAASTVEPAIVHWETARRAYAKTPWQQEALRPLEDILRLRLAALDTVLTDREWLEDGFTAGDLLVIQALRRLEGTDLLEAYPHLPAYMARGKTRPAFMRAFQAQRETWLSTTTAPDRDAE